MRLLEIIRSAGISPARDIAIQRHLLAQMERSRDGAPRAPVLHLGWLEGSAIALGRYQRRRSAISAAAPPELQVLRRPTGGRAVRMTTGQLSLSLALGDPSAALPVASPAIGPEKIINRYVRGLLGGLQRSGFRAYFFGRDFLSVDRKLGGYLSFEVAPGGAALFHALLAVETPTTVPAELNGYPGEGGNRPDPEPTTLAREARAELDRTILEEAIVASYVRTQEMEGRTRAFSPLEETLLGERETAVAADRDALPESDADWSDSPIKPIACGWLEASVQVVQERFLGAVRLFGDFMAPSGAVEALEHQLRLVSLDWREVGLVVDRVFGEHGNPLVGVRHLRVLPDAIVEAAHGVVPHDDSNP